MRGDVGALTAPDAACLLLGDCLADRTELYRVFERYIADGLSAPMAGLPGAYTCVLSHRSRLLVHTDPAGQFPLFISCSPERILLGSDLKVLARLHARPVDALTMAARIACPDILPAWQQRTYFDGVSRLGAGQSLALDLLSGALTVESAEIPAPTPRIGIDQAAEQLAADLAAALGPRCAHGAVGSDFSGGFDSTSLAMLAARMSQAAITGFVYHQPLAPAADLAEALRCAEAEPRLGLRIVNGTEDSLPYQGLYERREPALVAAAAAGDEPWPGAVAWRRSDLRLRAAEAAGVRTHLTGEGGDAVLTAGPAYLADLVRPRSMSALITHTAARARVRDTSAVAATLCAVTLSRTSASKALTRAAREILRPRPSEATWLSAIDWWPRQPEAAGWLRAPVRRAVSDILGDAETARRVAPGSSASAVATLTAIRNSADAQRHLRYLGRAHGLEVCAPFLDNAVVRTCMRTPTEVRAGLHTYKPLLQAALAQLVPGVVFERRTKGDYSAEDYLGARRARREIRALLRDSRLADLGVIEPDAVHASLERLDAGIRTSMGPLNQLLACELWLRARENSDRMAVDHA